MAVDQDIERIARRLQEGDETISDEDLRRLISAATTLYATRTELSGEYPSPLDTEQVTATQIVTLVSEMLRSAEINLFDLAMWYRRPRQPAGGENGTARG